MCYSRGRGEARGVSKCAIVGGMARREGSLSVL